MTTAHPPISRTHIAALTTVALLSTAPTLAAEGDLDTTFRGTGKLTYITATASVAGTALDASGRLLLAYTKQLSGTDRDFAYLRIPDSGAILACSMGIDLGGTDTDEVYAMAVAPFPGPNGQIVYLAGSAAGPAGAPERRAAVAAFNNNTCAPDSAFDGDGRLAIANAPGSELLATGLVYSPQFPETLRLQELHPQNPRIEMSGYFTDGTLDNGWSDFPFDISGTLGAVDLLGSSSVRQANGKILIVGTVLLANGDRDVVVARYNSGGGIDNSFSSDGLASFSYDIIDAGDDFGNAIAELPDHRLVIAGTVQRAGGKTAAAVAVLTASGQFDNSFGSVGRYAFDLANASGKNQLRGVAIQDQKIVVVGASGPNVAAPNYDFAIARLQSTGSSPLDTSFSGDGIVKYAFDLSAGTADVATSVVIDAQRRITVGGYATTSDGGLVPAALRLVAPPLPVLPSDGFESGGLGNWSSHLG